LCLKIILKIIYKYIRGDMLVDIAFELDIDRQTIGKWAELVREAISFYVEENSSMLGGYDEEGNMKVVEMDESLFFRRKYNRGKLHNNQWYIGGIERGSRKVFIVPVPNRNAITISEVISQNILPGTLIITDQWRAYNRAILSLENFSHATVNHSVHFVDPTNPAVHTQNIEGLWSRSKYFLRKKRGCSREQQSEYLIQFIFEYNVENRKRFSSVLALLNI
jgi:transposase-like protein